MVGYRSTSEHGWLQKYKQTWLATEVQANTARYRSTSEYGWLQEYTRTRLATEVQANMAGYNSTREHGSLALKRVKLRILSVPWRKETLRNHNNKRRNRQLLYTVQCSVLGLKSREATDMTYRSAQQTAEFVMPSEVMRNAKRMTGDTAIRSAVVYKQEIQPSDLRWCINRRYTELKEHRRKCGVTFDTGTGITAYARLRALAAVKLELPLLRYVTPCRWASSH